MVSWRFCLLDKKYLKIKDLPVKEILTLDNADCHTNEGQLKCDGIRAVFPSLQCDKPNPPPQKDQGLRMHKEKVINRKRRNHVCGDDVHVSTLTVPVMTHTGVLTATDAVLHNI